LGLKENLQSAKTQALIGLYGFDSAHHFAATLFLFIFADGKVSASRQPNYFPFRKQHNLTRL